MMCQIRGRPFRPLRTTLKLAKMMCHSNLHGKCLEIMIVCPPMVVVHQTISYNLWWITWQKDATRACYVGLLPRGYPAINGTTIAAVVTAHRCPPIARKFHSTSSLNFKRTDSKKLKERCARRINHGVLNKGCTMLMDSLVVKTTRLFPANSSLPETAPSALCAIETHREICWSV